MRVVSVVPDVSGCALVPEDESVLFFAVMQPIPEILSETVSPPFCKWRVVFQHEQVILLARLVFEPMLLQEVDEFFPVHAVCEK